MRAQKINLKDCKKIALSRKGRCLSLTIKNANEKLKWQCKYGHIWNARTSSVKIGSWCPNCARKNKRLTIYEMKQLAEMKGGKCLSKVYINNNTHLEWMCKDKHKWLAKPSNIKLGRWCKICSGVKKKTIGEIKEYCKNKGGECLSNVYSNIKAKLEYKCKEGHKWTTTAEAILRGGWCPKCADNIRAKKKSIDIQEPIELAKRRNGQLLSLNYKNCFTPLLWQCQKGHKWKANYSNVKLGTWCPHCAGKFVTLRQIKEAIRKKGGKLLSTTYISAKHKLDFACGNKHKFKMPWASIKSGSWCPECTTSIGERICREFFEKIFDCKFPKSYPKWLISDRGYQLELDGYSDLKGIAFEHQGRHHYSFLKSKFYENKSQFNRRIKLDIEKKNLCRKHKILLIQVPEIPYLLPITKVFSFLHKQLKKNNIHIPQNEDSLQLDWKRICTPPLYDKFVQIQKIAKRMKGKCLSTGYFNNRTKMKFVCKYGHEWEAAPTSILSGSWCRNCFLPRK